MDRFHGRALLLVLTGLALACNNGGGGSPTDPGSNMTLALTAMPTSIAVGGQAEVIAQVTTTGGVSRAGLRIALDANLGQLDDRQLTTDANGRAATTLRAGATTGVARVTGTVEGRSSAAVEVRIGLDRTLRVEIEPSTITGNAAATVTVFAFEGTGAPLPPGTAVTLATDRGQLGAAVVTTDVQGAATTTLRSGGATGTARVTATLGNVTATAQATFLAPPPGGTTLRLTASPPSTPANGTSTLTVLVAGADGTPLQGVEVLLSSTIGNLDATRVHTDSTGLATTTLRGTGRRGTATITATLAGTSTTSRATVRFT
jgi:hypothetical protein